MARMACIAGEQIYRQWDAGRISGERLEARKTPFGPSREIFLADPGGCELLLLPRYGTGLNKRAPRSVNYRANLYALKDLGAEAVLAWGPVGAITHNIAVGDLVVLNDVIDMTYLRAKTFFEHSPLGFLRQFPVFCPALAGAVTDVLAEMRLVHHDDTVAAVVEGPRLETPAEVRMLSTIGAEVVTHTFVPELFLAKELELCYAALGYVVNYAETGSRHRPFAAGELFGGLTQKSDRERLGSVMGAMSTIVANVCRRAEEAPPACACPRTMDHYRSEFDLPEDWRDWVRPAE